MWAHRKKLRRRRGRELIANCPSDWRRRQLIHWCHGCCDTKQMAVEQVFGLLTEVGVHALSAPRQSKWLSQSLRCAVRCPVRCPVLYERCTVLCERWAVLYARCSVHVVTVYYNSGTALRNTNATGDPRLGGRTLRQTWGQRIKCYRRGG